MTSGDTRGRNGVCEFFTEHKKGHPCLLSPLLLKGIANAKPTFLTSRDVMLSVATQNYNLAVCQKQFFCFAQIAAKEIATITSFIENTILGRSKIESKSISSTYFPRKKVGFLKLPKSL